MFDVWFFFPDDTHIKEYENLSAEEAVEKAAQATKRPAAQVGMITKIMITDKDDYAVFIWEFGKGVVLLGYKRIY